MRPWSDVAIRIYYDHSFYYRPPEIEPTFRSKCSFPQVEEQKKKTPPHQPLITIVTAATSPRNGATCCYSTPIKLCEIARFFASPQSREEAGERSETDEGLSLFPKYGEVY